MSEINETELLQLRRLLAEVLKESEYRNIERLGGLTNHTYRVELRDGRNYAIRLPGEGTEVLINRSHEKISTELACCLGIDAPLLHFGARGEKVTVYIDGAVTMSAESFLREDVLRGAAEVLRVLHTSGADTKVPFDVFDMAAGYEKIIRDNSVPMFADYDSVRAQVMRVRRFVSAHTTAAPVPCHNDPLCENWVMDAGGKLHLIDWEYAGMNDGMWDLADLSIEAAMSEEQE
jgi:thiamine kinase-like enzyme